MSWKPCRGGRVMLDNAVEKSHSLYFSYQEATNIKDKSKIAFQWLRAEQYLGNEKRFLKFIGDTFIQNCKQNKDTYKPFLNYLNTIQNANTKQS